MVNSWFAERVHSIQPSASKENPSQHRAHQSSTDPGLPSSTTILPPTLSLLDNRCPSPATVPSPAPGTPTRKISASEFDRPLRPIVVKDSEGSLTFLSDADPGTVSLRGSLMGEGGVGNGGGYSGAGSGSGGDRCARLLELVKDVSSHLDVTALCHKIFLHINELIAADRYSLFLVRKSCVTNYYSNWLNVSTVTSQSKKKWYIDLYSISGCRFNILKPPTFLHLSSRSNCWMKKLQLFITIVYYFYKIVFQTNWSVSLLC